MREIVVRDKSKVRVSVLMWGRRNLPGRTSPWATGSAEWTSATIGRQCPTPSRP